MAHGLCRWTSGPVDHHGVANAAHWYVARYCVLQHLSVGDTVQSEYRVL